MQRFHVDFLKGTCLVYPICHGDRVVISSGQEINEDIIEKLKSLGLSYVNLNQDTKTYYLESVAHDVAGSLFEHFEEYRDDNEDVSEKEHQETIIETPEIILTDGDSVHPVTGKTVKRDDPGFMKAVQDQVVDILVNQEGQEDDLKVYRTFHEEWSNTIKGHIPDKESVREIFLDNAEIYAFTNKVKSQIIYNSKFPKKSIPTFLNLLNIAEKKSDSMLYEHMMEVAMLSTMAGMQKYKENEDILGLMLGGLLHDIGMLKVPFDIRHKTSPLTDAEREIMQKHPLNSAMIIKNCFNDENSLHRTVFAIAMQHHWNNRGNGYYRQQQYIQKIPFIDQSKIVAICNTYAAMIEKRPYRDAIEPFEAIQTMDQMRRQNLFDGYAYNLFIKIVGYIPNSTFVKVLDTKLSDHSLKNMLTGIVCEQNPGHPNTPSIKLLDGSGKILTLNEMNTRYKIGAIYYKGKYYRI